MARDVASVGVVEQGSAVVLVTVTPQCDVIDRRQVELLEAGLSSHPHHHEGSWAVGRYLETPGAKRMPLADAVALVERVRASAVRGAGAALEALAAAVALPIASIALRAFPELPPTTEQRIRDHRAQTYADSAMYREVLANTAAARGWAVHWYDRDRVLEDAAAVLGDESIESTLRAMRSKLGSPWQAKHQLAAAAAIAATKHAR